MSIKKREIVSENKKHMKDAGFSQDLSYICPRIIGMSFPAHGQENISSNNIKDVPKFIKERHANDFHIYNLSGITYQKNKFDGKVSDFHWEDHQSTPIDTLLLVCKHIDDFLSTSNLKFKDKIANVVVVHCQVGKGRTGTAICCYLLYSGRFSKAEDAISYYSKKRFSVGGGVNQPSMRRYVQYFEQIIKGPLITPTLKYISTLTLVGVPIFSKNSCRPYIEVFNIRENKPILVYTDKLSHQEQKKYRDLGNKELNVISIQILSAFIVYGDVLIRVIHNGKFQNELMFRFSFNTAFIPSDNTLTFDLNELDPGKTIKDTRFPSHFYCEVKLTDYCKCKNTTLFEQKCKDCKRYMTDDIKQQWNSVHEVMEEYRQHTLHESKIMLFGDPEFDDQSEVLYSTKKSYLVPDDHEQEDSEFQSDEAYFNNLSKISEKQQEEDQESQDQKYNPQQRAAYFKQKY